MSATHRWIVCLIFSLVIHGQVLGHHFAPSPAREQGTIHVTLDNKGYAATSENTFALRPTLAPLTEEKGDAGADQKKQILNSYLKQVKKEIHRNKFSSVTKGRKTMIGNVKYRFSIDQTGGFTAIRLVQSSGDPAMDTAAKQAINVSSHRIKRPQSTGTTPITLEITIKYQYGL
ncbi:MAG: TonB family protein [Desulfobacteraceae bacterium]|nr:TonB family protein [Desulfobacteraceae bacterium]